MRILSAGCIIAATLLFTSCRMNTLKGSGDKTTTNPAVASFTGVDVDLPVKIQITVQAGAQPGVQLSGYENVIKHITAKVENNILVLSTDLDKTWNIDGEGITVQVIMPSINGLSLTGAADADIHGNMTGSYFDLDITGASTVVIDNINVDSFSTEVSGAGDLKINGGAVKYAEYEIDGAGDVKAFALQSGQTDATISGAGSGEVNVQTKLTAEINGAGTIKYKGHPTVSQEVNGAGTIKEAN